MPTPKSNANRWGLPQNLEPIGTRCLSVFVPDDPEWISLFLGAIYRLSQQIWYDRDPNHSAKIVARRWLDVYLDLMERMRTGEAACQMFDIRINPANVCELQKTTDGGQTWEFAADLSQCWKQNIKRDPNSGGLGWYDGIDFYRFPDGAWVDDPVRYPPPSSAGRTGTSEQIKCDAAYGAALALQALYRETWDVFTNFAVLGVLTVAQRLLELVNTLTNGFVDLAWMIDQATAGYQQSSNFVDGGFPDSEIETVQNILFCAATETDGVVTFDFNEVVTEFGSRVSDPYGGLNVLLQLFLGEDGLNAAGTVKAGSGDCSESGCIPDCVADKLNYDTNVYTVATTPDFFRGSDGIGVVQYTNAEAWTARSWIEFNIPAGKCIWGIRIGGQGSSAGVWYTANVFHNGVLLGTVNTSNSVNACGVGALEELLPINTGGVLRLERATGNAGSDNYRYGFKCVWLLTNRDE